MKEWGFAQSHPNEELAQVHFFSMKKQQASGEIEFMITVKEYITPKEPTMHFFAQADKETNQNTAPTVPAGGEDDAGSAVGVRARHQPFPLRREVTADAAGWKANDFDLDLHRRSVDCLWGPDYGSRDVGTVRSAGEAGSPGGVARGHLVGLLILILGAVFVGANSKW